jgi:5-methylthioadenosine/S-adenosylhomocysteine deaminase
LLLAISAHSTTDFRTRLAIRSATSPTRRGAGRRRRGCGRDAGRPDRLCIHCSEADIGLIAQSQASVVYTPTSEAIRGGGIGPAAAMAGVGENVALGSDGPMVDYSVDRIEQMKACSMFQNVKHFDPSIMPPERSLEFATINAATALGLQDEIGSFEHGKRADIALFNLKNSRCIPVNNPITALIFSAKETDAHTVFVNGDVVVRDHKLVREVDLEQLNADVAGRLFFLPFFSDFGDAFVCYKPIVCGIVEK